MTTTVIAGALLAAAAAPAAAHLAVRTAHQQIDNPTRTRAVLAILAAIFGGLVAARHGPLALAAALPALVLATAAAVVDAHERRLPDPLTAALAAVITGQLAVLLVVGNDDAARGIWVYVGGAAGCLLAKALLPDAIGWGDVKLAPSLAALLAVHSWSALYTGVLGSCVLVLVTAVLDHVRHNPVGIVAYGPALVAGAAYGLAS